MMNADCLNWNGAKFHRDALTSAGKYAEADEMSAKMLATAQAVFKDPRRQRAVQESSPECALAMKALLDGSGGTAPEFLDLNKPGSQMPALTDEQFHNLLSAVEAERERRIQA